MKNPFNATVAAAAFAAPLAIGMALTAGASVGGDEGDPGGSHAVDQWSIEQNGSGEYTLDREEIDGVVTLVVTGPDGNVLAQAELPEFVQEAAAEFGADDWQPSNDGGVDPFDVVDGEACYLAEVAAASSDSNDEGSDRFGYVEIGDDHTKAVELFEDGRLEAVQFNRALSQDEIDAVVENSGSYFDLDGAEPLEACEG